MIFAMQKLIVLFAILSALFIKFGSSCTPCTCSKSAEWTNLKLGNCEKKLNLYEIPITMDRDIDVLTFEWQTLLHLHENHFEKYHFNKIQTMYLRNNKIKSVEKNAFKGLKSVQYLSLSENAITELPNDLFNDTPNLVEFWINNNNVPRLQKSLFSNLKFLKTINIYKANVAVIEEGCFTNLPSLRSLVLNYNKLKTLVLDVEFDLKNLKILNFGGNPWHCDEKICGLIAGFVNNKYTTSNNEPHPVCESPSNMKGMPWKDVNISRFPLSFYGEIAKDTQAFILRCKSCQPSTFQWFWDLNVLQQNKKVRIFNNPQESTVIVYNVTEENFGTYTCAADKAFGRVGQVMSVLTLPKSDYDYEGSGDEGSGTKTENYAFTSELSQLEQGEINACPTMSKETVIILLIILISMIVIITILSVIICYYKNKIRQQLINMCIEENQKL